MQIKQGLGGYTHVSCTIVTEAGAQKILQYVDQGLTYG